MPDCISCVGAGTPTYKYPCCECRGYSKYEAKQAVADKPKTNGDRIRAMSDEELADLLTSANKGAITDICRKMHYEHNLQWLKQPAEEG